MVAERIQLANVADFTGGLTLAADGFQLAKNETPDCLNVDFDARGGFRQRKGAVKFSTTVFANSLKSLAEYTTSAGGQQIIGHDGANVFYSTGGNFSTMAARGGIARTAVFKDNLYIVGNNQAAWRWDGTTKTNLGTAWNHDATPNTGNMPLGKLVASHMGSLWVANCRIDGVPKPNRIYWSAPNFPESWRSFDFIDIDIGADGDEITALVPWGDHMIVFKKRAMYALYGSSPDTFQVKPISRTHGAISQEAVVPTDLGVFFFSWPDGVYRYTSGDPEYIFDKLHPALTDGSIPHSAQAEISLGWGNRRLWLGVPWRGSDARSRCFVMDPTVGGAWTAYDLPVGPFLEFNPPGADALFFGADCTRRVLLRLDASQSFDTFVAGTDTPIKTRYRTAWMDGKQPSLKKRFVRPEVVTRMGDGAAIFVNVYWDYDPGFARRSFTLETTETPDDVAAPSPELSGLPAAEAGWNVSQFGQAKFARSFGGSSSDGGGGGAGGGGGLGLLANEVMRGRQLGACRAVALEFRGPETLQAWGVDSVTFKFVTRAPRS